MYEQFGNYTGYPYMHRPVPQPIQSISQPAQQQIIPYSVKSASELANMPVMPNTIYLGINSDGKELYVRKMNLDGNVELNTYGLINGTKEKTELQAIADKIDEMKSLIANMGVKHESTDVA
jgi:hypothetical protein